ncbi:hypothetical protein PYCC9005_002147 [Savitreella phatthalungensis]
MPDSGMSRGAQGGNDAPAPIQQHRSRDLAGRDHQVDDAMSVHTTERVFPASSFVKSPAAASQGNPFDHSSLQSQQAVNVDPSGSTATSSEPPRNNVSANDRAARSAGTQSHDRVAVQQMTDTHPLMSSAARREAVEHATGHDTTVVNDKASVLPNESEASMELLTDRFEHRITADGRHLVWTGLKDKEVESCEDEPIHIPGAIQWFGVLISLRQLDPDTFEVVHVSENSGDLLGLPPKYLFSLKSFTDVLPEDFRDALLDQFDYLDDSNAVDQPENDTIDGPDESQIVPEVFLLRGYQSDRNAPQWQAWCALHRLTRNDNLYILEFEPSPDLLNPLTHDLGGPTAANGRHGKPGMDGEGFGGFSEDDLMKSTTSASKPIRRIRKSTIDQDRGNTMEIFSILSQCNEQLSAQQDLESFLRVVAGIVKDITKFHRVMVYQFDDQWNGQVVTELVDWERTKDLFQGLFFPATDIPAQARALYKLNKIRVLYDRDAPTARLVCRSKEDKARPLDMTHSFLRAMSPIHMQYLRNMGVRASFSISITAFGELWGLIACHTYGNVAQRCSFLVRKLCRLLGEQISHNIERLSYASRLTARKILTSAAGGNMSGYIVSKAEDLLGLFEADSGLLNIGDEAKMLNDVGNSQEALVVREYFRQKRFDIIKPSTDLNASFTDLQYGPGFRHIAGLLYIPLSDSGVDFILFFRRGQLKNVYWAGNPYEKVVERTAGKTGVLLPRQSFKVWSESVVGKCKDWSGDQIETAAILRLVYGRFIEIWREKQAALQTSRMASILLRNAGHEVRTPLNAIMNYIELALEGDLDPEVRDNLQASYTASQSLVYVINDLLDLTKAEAGNALFRSDAFDIGETVKEAVSMYRNQAERKGIRLGLGLASNLPPSVLGDKAKVRQVLGNVIANGIKHTDEGYVDVHMSCRYVDNSHDVEVAIAVSDSGSGISEKKLDEIFQTFESVVPATNGGDVDVGEHTGLGLAIVARVVRNMNGQLRCESKVGRGSTFTFVFRLELVGVDDADDPAAPVENRGGETPGLTDVGASRPEVKRGHTARSVIARERSQRVRDSDAPAGLSATGCRLPRKTSVASTASEEHNYPKDADFESVHSRSHQGGRRLSTDVVANIKSAADKEARSESDDINSLVQAMLTNSTTDHSVKSLEKSISAVRVPGQRKHSQASSIDSRHELPSKRRSRPSSSRSEDGNGLVAVETRKQGVLASFDKASQNSKGNRTSLPNSLSLSDQGSIDTGILGTDTLTSDTATADQDDSITSAQYTARPRVSTQHDIRAVKMQSEDVWMPDRQYRGLGALNMGAAQHHAAELPSSHGLRVLVAEDDAINRAIIKKRLLMDKHEVVLKDDGLECFEEYSVASQDYDVILMDMQMPNLDGMGASRKIRELEKASQLPAGRLPTPIIAVSASLTEDQAQDAIDAGIDGWILKPVDFARLRHLFKGIGHAEVRKADLYMQESDGQMSAPESSSIQSNVIQSSTTNFGNIGSSRRTPWTRGGWLTLQRTGEEA